MAAHDAAESVPAFAWNERPTSLEYANGVVIADEPVLCCTIGAAHGRADNPGDTGYGDDLALAGRGHPRQQRLGEGDRSEQVHIENTPIDREYRVQGK